jgi:hypothetical protein
MVRTEVTTMVRSVFAADVRGVRMGGIVRRWEHGPQRMGERGME